MRCLHYAGDSILVGDAVARAIEEYAMVLAQRQGADVLTLPATTNRSAIELVLGPASQLFSDDAEGPAAEDGDEALLADIRDRLNRGAPTARAVPEDASSPSQTSTFTDFDV